MTRGPQVSVFAGAEEVRPFQVGFPAELTGTWNASTGYPWKQLLLSGVAVAAESIPLTGDLAVTPDNDATLASGTVGWLEPDPQAGGWLFLPGAADGLLPGSVAVTQTAVNGDPATQLTVYPSVSPTPATDPQVVIVAAEDVDTAGTPGVQFVFAPTGTAGNQLQFQVTEPVANDMQFQVGARDGLSGQFQTFTYDGSDRVVQLQQDVTLYDAGNYYTGDVQYTVDGGEVLATIGAGLNYLYEGDVEFTGTVDLSGATVIGLGGGWTKYTKTFADLAAAAASNDIQILSLPAGGVILGIIVRHTAEFQAPGLMTYVLSVGVAGNATKYTAGLSVNVAPDATTHKGFYPNATTTGVESFTGATSIRLFATSTGADLDDATQGSVDIWVKTDTLP
jgi:hypothetical protein